MPKDPPPAIDPLPGPDVAVITAALVLLMIVVGVIWAMVQ